MPPGTDSGFDLRSSDFGRRTDCQKFYKFGWMDDCTTQDIKEVCGTPFSSIRSVLSTAGVGESSLLPSDSCYTDFRLISSVDFASSVCKVQ